MPSQLKGIKPHLFSFVDRVLQGLMRLNWQKAYAKVLRLRCACTYTNVM